VFEIAFDTGLEIGDKVSLAFELIADFLNTGFDAGSGGRKKVIERDDIPGEHYC